jgi:hypothetical protein
MKVSNSAFYKDLQVLRLDPNRSGRIFAEDSESLNRWEDTWTRFALAEALHPDHRMVRL